MHNNDSISDLEKSSEKRKNTTGSSINKRVYKMVSYKKDSLKLAGAYKRWGEEEKNSTIQAKAVRVAQCSEYWTGLFCPYCGRIAHLYTYGCKDRLCPLCAHRKARAVAAQAMQVVRQLEGVPALLTLTIRNVSAEELAETVDGLLAGWRKIYESRPMKKKMIAWARTLEITYNDAYEDYHPHIHVIMYIHDHQLLRADYWDEIWRGVMNLDYHPILEVHEIVGDASKAVYEVSKYVTKMSRIFKLSHEECYEVVKVMSKTIYKRRLKAYGGEWGKVRRKMSMKEVDTMDDGEIDMLAAQLDGDVCCSSRMIPIVLEWSGMEYKMTKG